MSNVVTNDLAALATGFSRALRGSGLETAPSSTIDFAEALTLLGTERPDHVFWAGRACFCRRAEDDDLYAHTFRAFFGHATPNYPHGRMTALPPTPVVRSRAISDDEGAGTDADENLDESDERPPTMVAYSATEVLRAKDFARYSEAELDEAARLISNMRLRPPMRRGRRLEGARERGRGALDVRRTLHWSLASGGDPMRLARRVRGVRARRVVLLLDVSGSMGPYARSMLRFAHATVTANRSVEAFSLGTRCTRITRQLSWRDPDAALARVASAAPDLEGGTRLGECLLHFNETWGLGGIARGAIVVFVSDGWDRGDASLLAAQMARLANVAHRVVWVNPLKASPGYEPLVRGMAAALPFTDEFLAGNSIDALDELAKVIAR